MTAPPCTHCEDFFAHEHSPNYRDWALMRYWSADEAALLACGFDPKVRPQRVLRLHLDHGSRWDAVRRLFELFERGRGLPASSIATPGEYLEWGSRHGIEFPAALTAAVREHQETHAALTTRPTKRRPEAEEREKNTLLKMVGGMARAQYAYDPRERRSSSAKKIADDMRRVGLDIDEDTARKWLKATDDLVDQNQP